MLDQQACSNYYLPSIRSNQHNVINVMDQYDLCVSDQDSCEISYDMG